MLDRRSIVIICGILICGFVIGATIGYSLGVSQQDGQMQNLQTQINALVDDVTTLQNQTAELLKPKSWHFIDSFNGTTDEITEQFTIDCDLWRITWSAEAEIPSLAVFGFFVYPKNESEEYILVKTVTVGDFSSLTSQHFQEYLFGKGEYYIDVICANLEDWRIVIETYS